MTRAVSDPAPKQGLSAGKRASGIETPWRGGLMIVIYVLTALLAYLGPLGFAPLVALGGLLCLAGFGGVRSAQPVVWPWLALALWSLISLIWSPAAPDPGLVLEYPQPELATAMKLLLQLAVDGVLIMGVAQLCEGSARRALWVLAGGMTLLAGVLMVEAMQGAAYYQAIKTMIGQPIRPDLAMRNVAQGTYVLALFFWSAALCLVSDKIRAYGPLLIGLMIVGLGLSSLRFSSDAPFLALLLGAMVVFFVQRAGTLACLVLTLANLVYWLVTPLLILFAKNFGVIDWAKQRLGASWDARLDIWTFATDRIIEHPLRGLGLDASRVFPEAIPLHTHNAALQVWLELGAVGAVLMCLGWVAIFNLINHLIQRDRNLGAVAAATAVTYLTIGAVSFGVWQEWWLALGALAFATIATLDRARISMRRQDQALMALERI
jgi:O-antigen ligase